MSRLSVLLRSFKGATKSTTVRFNVLAGLLWFLGVLSDASFVTENPEWMGILGGITAIVNLFLRAKTTKPLKDR